MSLSTSSGFEAGTKQPAAICAERSEVEEGEEESAERAPKEVEAERVERVLRELELGRPRHERHWHLSLPRVR